MKTICMIVILPWYLAVTDVFSQIPNSGFENWTSFGNYMNPDSWYTTNSSSSGSYYPVTRDTSHYPPWVGNYSIRIESNPALLPGGESLGAVSTGTGFNLTPDIPISGHPTSLTGYYRFLPQNGDTMHLVIVLFNNSVMVAVGILDVTAPAPNWTPFSIPISGYSTANSAKIYLGAYYIDGPPPQFVPHGNSVLFLDNLNFDNFVSDGSVSVTVSDVTISPNPSNGSFTLTGGDRFRISSVKIMNSAGKETYGRLLTEGNSINIEIDENSGMYFFILQSETGERIVLKALKE